MYEPDSDADSDMTNPFAAGPKPLSPKFAAQLHQRLFGPRGPIPPPYYDQTNTQQVPLIELESNPPNVARNGSDQRDGRRKLKRNRPEEFDEERRLLDNAINNNRPSKRPKNSGRNPSRNSVLTISAGVPDIPKTRRITSKTRKIKDSITSPNQSSRVSELSLRRSSRIAEREQRLKIRFTTAQLPSPPSSIPPKKPNKRSSARTTKRDPIKPDDRRHTPKTKSIPKKKRRTHL